MSFPPPSPRQARVLWFSLTTLTLVSIVGLVALGLGWLLKRLSAVLLPVALALILAYILDPLVEFFVRKKLPRVWSILLVFLIGAIVGAGLIGSVVPGLLRESRKLVEVLGAKDIQGQVKRFLKSSTLLQELENWSGVPIPRQNQPPSASKSPANPSAPGIANRDGATATNNVEVDANTEESEKGTEPTFIETFVPTLAKTLASAVSWLLDQLGTVTTWVEFVVGFVLVPVYLFYFLVEKHKISKHWTDYLPIHESKAKEELVFVLKVFNECMSVFFRGQVLVALCVGVLVTTGYLLLGLHYALLLGSVAAILGIVPYLGTITSLVIALTVAAMQFGDWTHPVVVLGIAAVVKMLEDFVISPKIIGDQSGLHPLTVILAVLIGGKLMGGFLGALVAVPLTAVLRTLMFRYVWKKPPRKSKFAGRRETGDLAS